MFLFLLLKILPNPSNLLSYYNKINKYVSFYILTPIFRSIFDIIFEFFKETFTNDIHFCPITSGMLQIKQRTDPNGKQFSS